MHFALPVANRDAAAAAAAKLIWGNLSRMISAPLTPANGIVPAIRPVYGVVWNRAVIKLLTTAPIHDALWNLRNSILPRSEYDRIEAFLNAAWSDAGEFQPELSEWRAMAERFRFDSSYTWDDILTAVTTFNRQGIATPGDLGAIPSADVLSLCQLSTVPNVTRAFWGAQRSSLTYGSTASNLFQPPGAVSRDSLLLAAKRHAKQYERAGRLHVHTSKELHAPADFARLCHARKIKLRGDRSVLPRTLMRFVEDSTQANLLKKVSGSLPGIASAFRCYLAFCELTKVPPFPHSEETVLRWSSVCV